MTVFRCLTLTMKVDQNFALRWVNKHVRLLSRVLTHGTYNDLRLFSDLEVWWRPSTGNNLGRIRRFVTRAINGFLKLLRPDIPLPGAGSALQHVIAEDGQTEPQLFRGAIASSTFLPSQYDYNDTIPQVRNTSSAVSSVHCS